MFLLAVSAGTIALSAASAQTPPATASSVIPVLSEPEPIETDRPDYTESTKTVPSGKVQIEGGYTFTRIDRHSTSSADGELLVRVAAGKASEIRIGLNSYEIDRGDAGAGYGLQDTDLGFKIKLREGGEHGGFRSPAVSFIGLTSLPTGTASERGNHFQPTAKLCLNFDLSPRFELSTNTNYSYVSDSDGSYSQFASSESLDYKLTHRLASFFEYYGFYPFREQPATHYADTGLTYLINQNTQYDVRVGTGLNGPADNFFLGTGASVRF